MKTENNESASKIYRAMRSLFRYSGFQNNNYPEVLIETEEKILSESFKNLTAKEIFYIFSKWPEFVEEQKTEQELDNDRLFSIINKELDILN